MRSSDWAEALLEPASTSRNATRRVRRMVHLHACLWDGPTLRPQGLAWQSRRDDAVRLQTQPEALPILGLHRVQPAELLPPLEPVRDRVPVCVDRRGGGVHVAVVLE